MTNMTLRYVHMVQGYHDDALARLAEINRRCATGGTPVVPITTAKKQKRGEMSVPEQPVQQYGRA
jgi:hypothetical protein